MSCAFRQMLAGDVVQLALQPSQHFELGLEKRDMTMQDGRDLVTYGRAWTAYQGGRILCCAGFRETFPGVQAVAWALLSEGIGAAHLAITRFARRQFDEAPYRRIEAIVDAANVAAIQWGRLVGMTVAHRLECFGASSTPHYLLERIKP